MKKNQLNTRVIQNRSDTEQDQPTSNLRENLQRNQIRKRISDKNLRRIKEINQIKKSEKDR